MEVVCSCGCDVWGVVELTTLSVVCRLMRHRLMVGDLVWYVLREGWGCCRGCRLVSAYCERLAAGHGVRVGGVRVGEGCLVRQ